MKDGSRNKDDRKDDREEKEKDIDVERGLGGLGDSNDDDVNNPDSTILTPPPSLTKALHQQFFWRWWFAGFLILVSRELDSILSSYMSC